MRTNYILVDLESVQPDLSQCLAHDHFRVLIFVGENQNRLMFETVSVVQQLGPRAQYIKISGNGPNALDFHIAYYIGQLVAADPSAYFHVISKDTVFDPLIQHLKDKKIFAGRVTAISEIPIIRNSNVKTPAERLQAVIDKLTQLKAAKPRTVKTLTRTIGAPFQKQISDGDAAILIQELSNQGLLAVSGTKVTYKLE